LLFFRPAFSLVAAPTTSNAGNAATVPAERTTATAASKFKAPNADIHSPEQIAEWKKQDAELWAYVESQVPAVLDHTGTAAFDEHLRGVQAVLRYWGAPEHVASAGLFHSIYGTEGFQGFALPLSERSAIQNMIGTKAEKLCFVFCMVDRSTLDQTVFEWDKKKNEKHQKYTANTNDESSTFTLRARPELGRFDMVLDKEEWLDFVELTLADWLEQVEGAATKPSELFLWKTGEAYSYRRLAYRKMSELLAVERSPRLQLVAPAMLEAVMATEAPETRQLVQPRTPPVSKAAADALDALRANGETIPQDLSPQPMTQQVNEQQASCGA
jgi:hypothetical protein